MAEWIEQQWLPADGPGLSRRARMGGTYRAFLPDPLVTRHIVVPAALSREASQVEQQIRDLSNRGTRRATGTGLEGIARFLLRSEAISSSRIEGLAPQPDKVAIAELKADSGTPGAGVAQLVANNVAILQKLSRSVHEAETVGLREIIAAQELLLGNPRISGLRNVQNWIGGSNYSPIGADFVPPPPAAVPGLMDDLVDYLNGATHGALIQAALTHAQFETIHPFADGNGRVGRALIHVVLQRRGLVDYPILPVSMVLGTWSDRYIHGLTRFRDTDEHSDGALEWLDIFIAAAKEAATQAARIARELDELREEWRLRVDGHRKSQGMTRALRSDSIESRILEGIPDHPLLTATLAAEIFETSRTSAGKALDNLVGASVLRRRSIDRGVTGFLADEVFELITLVERRLASTRFDTRLAPPVARPVPVVPPRRT